MIFFRSRHLLFILFLTLLSDVNVNILNCTVNMNEMLVSPEEKILEAAKAVFIRKGYEAATMGDIAAEAGISRTALNYYYRTKENLFEAIFGQIIQTFLLRLEQVADAPVPFLEKIEPIAAQYTQLFIENPLLPMFVASEMQRDARHLLEVVKKLKENNYTIFKIVTQLTDEMEKGHLRKVPLIDVATTFMGMITFPVLARNLLTILFMDGEEEKVKTYLQERIRLVVDVMTGLLLPR